MKEERTENVALNEEQMEQVVGGFQNPLKPDTVTRDFTRKYCRFCMCTRNVLTVKDHGIISYTCTVCGNTP